MNAWSSFLFCPIRVFFLIIRTSVHSCCALFLIFFFCLLACLPLRPKVDELKAQLAKMGLPTKGVKAVLIERLAEGLLKFSLSDDNFQHAPVTDTTVNDKDLPNCFPQVREVVLCTCCIDIIAVKDFCRCRVWLLVVVGLWLSERFVLLLVGSLVYFMNLLVNYMVDWCVTSAGLPQW